MKDLIIKNIILSILLLTIITYDSSNSLNNIKVLFEYVNQNNYIFKLKNRFNSKYSLILFIKNDEFSLFNNNELISLNINTNNVIIN